MKIRDEGFANSCTPYADGQKQKQYSFKSSIIGEKLIDDDWCPEVKLRRLLSLIGSIGADKLRESSTSGLSIGDIQDMRTHISSVLSIYDRAQSLVDDMEDYEESSSYSSHIDNISIDNQVLIVEDLEDEMARLVEYYIKGFLPYLTPIGAKFEHCNGVYKYRKEENENEN